MLALRSVAASALAAAVSLTSAVVLAQPAPRVAGSSVSIEPKQFGARVVVSNDPGSKVARVVFSLAPRCAADPSSTKYTSVPEVVATTATVQGTDRVFTATIPDPSGGAFGAWTLRSTALDAAGKIVGRHQSVIVRRFEPRFRALRFGPAGAQGAAKLDTSAGPATAQLVIDLDHDAPVTSLGLVTSAHDNPSIGYTQLPGALVADRDAGTTPWLTSRLERSGPGAFVGHFGFPASTPPMTLAITRMFLTDARCRTAELAPPTPLALAVSSKAPRAMPVDVRLDRAALADGKLLVSFRLLGPAPRSAPAPEIGGQPAQVVKVELLDTATPPRVLGSTAARPVPASPLTGKKWDGQSLAIAPIAIPPGPTALGEALKKGLQIEIDDGGKPLAPRAVLRGR